MLLGLFFSGAGVARASIDFTHFHTPTQVDSEVANLATSHPAIARRLSIGNSLEGRPIWALEISQNVSVDDPDKGDVVYIATHHAREWIAAEMGLYLAEYLVTHYDTDAALQSCMNNLRVWIIPVANPDGYVFSAANVANRYWRKNRRDNGDGSFGVDLNRNFTYAWGLDSADADSHSDTYRGPTGLSEPENIVLRNFLDGLHKPRAFVTYHSPAEAVLVSWRYTTVAAPGAPTLNFIQQDSINRIAAVHGTTYSTTIGYTSSGNVVDYLWGEMRTAAFTEELGGGDFVAPDSAIIPNCEENLPAALALIKDAGCRFVWIKDYVGDTGVEPSAVWLGDHWSHAFWTSPDITTVPETLVGGSTVSLNVRVHNDGPVTAGSIVRAYYTDPHVSLEFPNPDAILIGQTTIDLPNGDTTVTFSWNVPAGVNSAGERHWCVGAVVSHTNDRPLTTQVQRSSNIACRNFYPVEGSGEFYSVSVTNFLDVAAEYHVTVDPKSLPPGWQVIIPDPPPPRIRNRKALLLRVRGGVLEPGKTIQQSIRIIRPKGDPHTFADINVNGVLLPLVAGKRVPAGNGVTFQVR
jgi:carboxypeptidase T